MIRINEHSATVHFFEASSKNISIKADTVRPVIIVKYTAPLTGRQDSFLLPRDPLLIADIADALSLLGKQLSDWGEPLDLRGGSPIDPRANWAGPK